MNLGLENLNKVIATDAVVESQDLIEIFANLHTNAEELAANLTVDDKLDLIAGISTGLKAANAEDRSLLNWVKSDLESLGIDVESNASAAAGIDAFVETHVSNEFLISEALIIAGMVALYIAYVAALIAICNDLGVWTAEMVTANEAMIDKGLRSEPVDESRKLALFSYAKYDKLMHVMITCFGIFADKATAFDGKAMEQIHSAMKSVGIPWDGNGYKVVDAHRLTNMTVGQANWTGENCKKGQATIKKLAVELAQFKGLQKKADAAAKEAKQHKVDPEATAEANAEKKAAAKKKAADMKQANKELRKFVSLGKVIVLNCGYTVQRALRQYAK